MNKIAPYYKAVAGFLVPLLGSLGTALLAGSDGGTAITASEWLTSFSLALVSGGVVFGVENKPAEEPKHAGQ